MVTQAAVPLRARSIIPVTAIVLMINQKTRFISVAPFRGLIKPPLPHLAQVRRYSITNEKFFKPPSKRFIFLEEIILKTVAEVLRTATARLEEVGIDSPRLDAEILLAHVLKCRRLSLYVDAEKILPLESILRFEELINRRIKKIPAAYLTGTKEFFGLNFVVNENVLIPRPDTEILAEGVGEFLRGLGDEVTFADLGTGSGAIAVSILKFVKNSRACAVDVSSETLDVAKFNAAKFHVDDRAEFFCGDMFAPLTGKIFNAVVSNPPYIPTGELESLQAEVQSEPRLALDGGEDGLNFYRRIVRDAPNFLVAGGLLAVEVGFNQAAAVKSLIEVDGRFNRVEVWKDLAGIDRVVAAHKS